jgi:alginate O-acetyltransferase complex protein AlgI
MQISLPLLAVGLIFILLAFATWKRDSPDVVRAGLVIAGSAGLIVLMGLGNLTLLTVAFDLVLIIITWLLIKSKKAGAVWGTVWIIALIVILFGAKLLPVSPQFAGWIGISYLIFRLIHMCLDARRDRVPDVTLSDSVVYALHPVTLVAGPIDRIQHNVSEQHCEPPDRQQYIADGLWRLSIGLFKKLVLSTFFFTFVTAIDMIRRPGQPAGLAWVWIIAYSFFLYFDFAAYSDIALGIGCLMGFRLPENFANPYMQPSITQFWQKWHMTLSTWLRDYIFFPLSRMLLKRSGGRFQTGIMFISHMTTMIICGLWHGIGTGFLAWGIWHGLGMFLHSRVTVVQRRFNLPNLPNIVNIGITFIFVSLGWVFFNTNVPTAIRILQAAFGLSS